MNSENNDDDIKVGVVIMEDKNENNEVAEVVNVTSLDVDSLKIDVDTMILQEY